MKVKTLFIKLTSSAYAPEREEPEKMHSGEIIYCRDQEITKEEMSTLITKVKRLIEKEIGLV